MKLGLQIRSFTWPGGPAAIGRNPRPASCAPPTTSGSTRSGSWTTSSRSGASASRTSRCSRAGRRSGWIAANTSRARLGLMVGGVHYRYPRSVGQGGDDTRRAVRRTGLARHRRGLERGGGARTWASRSRRSSSASSCSRRRSQIAHEMWDGERGSEGGVRRAATSRRRACSTPRSRCRGRGSRS